MLGLLARGDAPAQRRASSSHPDDARERVGALRRADRGQARPLPAREALTTARTATPVWTDLTVSLVRDDDGEPQSPWRWSRTSPSGTSCRSGCATRRCTTRSPACPTARCSSSGSTAVVRRRAAGRPRVGALLPRPRRLQGDQRHARPRRRRPAAGRGRPPARAARSPARAPGRPDGRRRVRDPGRGLDRRPATSSTVAETGAGRAVATPFRIGGHQLSVLGQHRHRRAAGRAAPTPADLMKAADITLYWAKADGQGPLGAVRPGAQRRARSARFTLAAALPRGAGARRVLRRVPADRLAGATVRRRGVEALVRWQHPQLRPARARPVHRAGRGDRADRPAGPVGAGAGLRAGRRSWWHTFGDAAPVRVSVNLAARQARDPELADDVADVLGRPALPPTCCSSS